MDDKSVKKKMKELREKENLSQLETAEKLGMSLRSYNSLETGETRIINKNLEKFAEITGSRLEDLLLGSQYACPSSEQEDFLKYKEMHQNTVKAYEEALAAARMDSLAKDKQIENLEDRLVDKEKLIRLLEKQLENS